MSDHRIGVAQGTALYVGAVLGAGVLALPALAAQKAGPASLISWAGLVVISIPVAAAFAALGMRYPDGGGISTFVARAYGGTASAPVGWWFYFAVSAGAPAASLVGGKYVAQALDSGPDTELTVAAILLVGAFATNWFGLRLSGRVQLLLVGLLALLLFVTIAIAMPDVTTDNFAPFAPEGAVAVLHAASLLFFSFSGWEAVTHLSGDFANPRRDLPIVTALALIVVAVLYLGLAVASIGVLGSTMNRSEVPLTLLLERGLGSSARAITAGVAALLTFGTMNAFIAGASRLGAALGRDGSLPAWVAKGAGPGEIPRRSLGLLASATAIVVLAATTFDIGLDGLMLGASACFVAVYVGGLAAAAKLLHRGGPAWLGAVVSLVLMLVVLAFSGPFLAAPLLLGLGAVAVRRSQVARPAPRGELST